MHRHVLNWLAPLTLMAAASAASAQAADPAADRRWGMFETYCTRMPQRHRLGGRHRLRHAGRGRCPAGHRAVGNHRDQAARPPDAAAGQQAAQAARKRCARRLARNQPRRPQGNPARRPCDRAAPEPHRIRQRRALAARHRDQGGRPAAARDRDGRLRQHRRRAHVSPSFLDQYIGAARFIAKRAVGSRRPSWARRYILPQMGETVQRHAAGHPRWHSLQALLPGRWRISPEHPR